MKKKTIEINGVTFTYRKGLEYRRIRYWDLNECYKNPSYQKRCAFNAWHKWFNEVSQEYYEERFGIHSYNCQYFTLIMQFEYDYHIYRCWVTGQNNYIEEVI